MENKSLNNAIDKLLPTEIGTDGHIPNADKNLVYEYLENYLNARILKITSIIENKYPELSEFLNEMPATIPSEISPEITLKNLKTYGESLNAILIKYELEHS